MLRVLTAEEMRGCDRHAIDVLGVPGVVLMENAGRAAAEEALSLLKATGGKRAWIYCGAGNNGGDGFVVARLLHEKGVPVVIVRAKKIDALGGDAATNARIADRLGIPMQPHDLGDRPFDALPGELVIDAILGTGLDRDVGGVMGVLVDEVNVLGAKGCPVLALDLPSGLNSDTGMVMGRAVQARSTVTFGYLKRGLLMQPGASLAGSITVADIGLPRAVETTFDAPPCHLLTEPGVRELLPSPPHDAHKGTFGHVLVIAGSRDRAGAAALVCRGALRSGAGLVTLAARAGGDVSIRAGLPEAMGVLLEGEGALDPADLPAILDAAAGKDVIVLGPGIPRGPRTGELIASLVEETGLPIVLDADGLNALEGRLDTLGRGASAPLILTPHPKEMSRLIGKDVPTVQSDRIGAASELAMRHGVYVVLKGAGTVIADPSGATAICDRGGPALATGGTGDVLAGVIAALTARGMPAFDACSVGVFAHALAGERAGGRLGHAGVIASDVALALGEVWSDWGW